MKIEEICTLLFENYNQLEDLLNDKVMSDDTLLSLVDIHPEQIARMARETGVLPNASERDVVEIFKILVRKNLLFAEYSQMRDASLWVSNLKKAQFPGGVANQFFGIIFDSLLKIKERKKFKEGKDNYDVLHKSSNWILFKVNHEAASCKLGSNTKWCISSTSHNYYDRYSEKNDIYMIHTKNDKYAILVNKTTKEIAEVQTSRNTDGQPSRKSLARFSATLAKDGVDIDTVNRLLRIDLVDGDEYVLNDVVFDVKPSTFKTDGENFQEIHRVVLKFVSSKGKTEEMQMLNPLQMMYLERDNMVVHRSQKEVNSSSIGKRILEEFNVRRLLSIIGGDEIDPEDKADFLIAVHETLREKFVERFDYPQFVNLFDMKTRLEMD